MKLIRTVIGFAMIVSSCSQINFANKGLQSTSHKTITSEYIEKFLWSKDKKLSWADFKAEPDENSREIAAITSCGFGFTSNKISIFSKPQITVSNVFYPQLSWVKPGQQNSFLLLQHEQLHFDICELYARKLHQQLSLAKLNYLNVKKKSELIFKDIYTQYLLRQKEYEEQTDYSLNTKKQMEWMINIGAELAVTER